MECKGKGKKVKILLNFKEKKKPLFSFKSLDNFKNHTGSSSKTMKKVTNFIRSNVGRNSIPKTYDQHLVEESNKLQRFYNTKILEFEIGKTKAKRPVIFADAEDLLKFIVDERKIIGDYEVKIVADGGQGFFKVAMSIIPKN